VYSSQDTGKKIPLHHNHFTAHWTLSRPIRVSRYQKGKTNLDFTEARVNEWQWLCEIFAKITYFRHSVQQLPDKIQEP